MTEVMRYALMDNVHSWSAFGLYLSAIVVLVGIRTGRQYRATGSSGFNGFRSRGLAALMAGLAFVLALISGVASPLLASIQLLAPAWTDPPQLLGVGFLVGAIIAVDGILLGLRAQNIMGASWRIGVDVTESTELITHGVFTVIRNPIFTALIIIQAGTALMFPTWLALAGVIAMIIACELQVRLVEEPYLLETHPIDYPTYMSGTGRFVPFLHRTQATATES